LVLQRDSFAGIVDRDDRSSAVRENVTSVLASPSRISWSLRGVENRVVPSRAGKRRYRCCRIRTADRRRPAVETASMPTAWPGRSVDHVVAGGLAEIDEVLQQALPRPHRAVAEIEFLDAVVDDQAPSTFF